MIPQRCQRLCTDGEMGRKRLSRVAIQSPDSSDPIVIDDVVRRDDSQTETLRLADEHAVKGIAVVFREFLQEAAVVDGGETANRSR